MNQKKIKEFQGNNTAIIETVVNWIKNYKLFIYLSLFLGILIPFSYLSYIEAVYLVTDSLNNIYAIFGITCIFFLGFIVSIYLPLFCLQGYAKSIRKEIDSCSQFPDRHLIIRQAKILNRWAWGGIILTLFWLVLFSQLPEWVLNEQMKESIFGIILFSIVFITPVIIWLKVRCEYPIIVTGLAGFASISFLFEFIYKQPNGWGFTLGVISVVILIVIYVIELNKTNGKIKRWIYNKNNKAYRAKIHLNSKPLLQMLPKYLMENRPYGRALIKRNKFKSFVPSAMLLLCVNIVFMFFITVLTSDLPSNSIAMESGDAFITYITGNPP